MKTLLPTLLSIFFFSIYAATAQEGLKLDVVGDNYSTGRMINFEVTTTLGANSDILQLVSPSGSTGQFIEFERGSNNIVGRINATGDIEFKNAEFDGAENTGISAALDIRSNGQRMLLDGNEIDGLSGLYLNFNSQKNIYLRTASTRTEINMEHENGSGAIGNGITIEHPGSNNEYWTFYVTDGDGNLEIYNQGALRGEFNDSNGNYSSVSDRRLKHNIRELEDILPKVALLQPKVYNFKNDKKGKDYIGFIAQDVEKVFPNLVNQGEGDTGNDVYTLDYTGFGVIAVAAIQEMQGKLNEKEEKVEELEDKVAALETQLDEYAKLADRLAALETNLQSCCMQHNLNSNENIDNINSSLADRAHLKQNIPNPFNEETIIQFYLPQKVENAHLQITDTNGKVVKRFVINAPGFGQVQLNAGGLPAGIYAYTLTANGALIDTKQMVLTR